MKNFLLGITLSFNALLMTNPSAAQDKPVAVELLGKEINTEYNEIAPVISPDGRTLYFSRISHPQNTHGNKGSQDIWFSEFRNNRWTMARRMPAILNKEVYNSIYSITPDGNTILLKGSFDKGTYQTRGFSIAKKNARGWSAPQKMDIPGYEKMSKGAFDCGFLSNDGRTLILSFSEKKNGKNDDLYVSFKEKNGTWTKPVSLGSDVNTNDFTETTPFLAADGVTLYFSSNRPGGQGGNDIYYTKRIDRTWKRWSKPVNLGPLVNTPGFDGYYTVSATGDFAYWTTFGEQSAGKGDVARLDLKALQKQQQQPKKDTTSNTGSDMIASNKTSTPITSIPLPDPVAMITGKVVDSKTGRPIEATIVFHSFPDGEEIGTATTDPATGEYKFTLPYGKEYTMRPVSPNFIAESERINLTDSTGLADGTRSFKEFNNKTMKLVPLEVGELVKLNNIFFETGKSVLNPESLPELDQMIQIMRDNPTIEIELGGHTDNVGSDASNLKLSQDRSDAVRTYLLSKGIAPTRVQSTGYGESMPIATNDTPEGQQMNRRVEFKIMKK